MVTSGHCGYVWFIIMWLKVVLCRPFWMSEIHFRSHFWPLQIDTELYFFLEIFDKMAAVGHFGSIGHFGFPKFTFDRNSGHFRSIQKFFFRRPFWMSENHFRSHFWPFLIDRPYWILDVQNSLSMAFLAISDPYGS